jgi:hypothetical protein
VRFVHFALFEATLLSPASYAADTLYLIGMGSLSWRVTRVGQMVRQYFWLYERTGILGWRPHPEPSADSAPTASVSG